MKKREWWVLWGPWRRGPDEDALGCEDLRNSSQLLGEPVSVQEECNTVLVTKRKFYFCAFRMYYNHV